ncbi:MAG: heavy metal translocating P-type ATPase [Candidatus Saccharibacteria bacterium]|nr:heavy metal translocating P-type ATPase [Candidatus Saccharibacteria bacterium]
MKRALKLIWTYRLLSLAIATAVVGLVLQILGFHTAVAWLLGTVAIIQVFPLLKDMFEDVRSGSYGIDILAATAVIFSVILGESWAAIVIVIMLTGGESLEAYAERRAHSELNALLKQAPTMAHVIRKNKIIDVKASDVHVGEKILIKPGEIVPVDAEIIEGTGHFDEANLTGESLPQSKHVGDQILSGSINQDGAITAKALHNSDDSQYQQIIKLVKSASTSKAPFVRLADRYSIPFTVAAYAIAGTVWVLTGDATRFLEVIVVATPCPLLLAAPIALVSGMARASKFGIIVKTGSALEKLAETRTMAFDKTGTLTKGDLSLAGITSFGSFKNDEVLSLAAGLEQNSNHVLAAAVTNAAQSKKIKVAKAKHVKEISGKGLTAHVQGKDVLVGNLGLLEDHGVELPKQFKPSSITQTAMYVAVDGALAGVLLLEDTIRDESQVTLQRLHELGIRNTILITGDNAASGRKVAKALGIKQMFAEALPGEKLQILEGITDRPVAFVGDGVNDAPSLTAADVGIAIGARGSTAASESADMVILPNDIGRVAIAVAIAQRTFRIATQSILVGIGLSLALMLVFATGKFTPLMGAVAQEVVDVVVIFNALRAHTGKLK